MLKTQNEKENLRKKCSCAAPKKSAESAECFSRRICRPPLGSIQNAPGLPNRLTVPGQNVKLQRSKSTSETQSIVASSCRKSLFSTAIVQKHAQISTKLLVPASKEFHPPVKGALRNHPSTTVRSKSVSTYTDHTINLALKEPIVNGNEDVKRTKRLEVESHDSGIKRQCGKTTSDNQNVGGNKRLYPHSRDSTEYDITARCCGKTPEIEILRGNKISGTRTGLETDRKMPGLSARTYSTEYDFTARCYIKTPEIQISEKNKVLLVPPKVHVTSSARANSTEYDLTPSIVSNNTLSQTHKQFINYLFEANCVPHNTKNSTRNIQTVVSNCTNNETTYTNTNRTNNSTISSTLAYNIDEVYNCQAGNSVSPYIEKCVQNKQVAHVRGPLLVANDKPFVDGQRFFREEPEISNLTENTVSPLNLDEPVLRHGALEKNSECLRRPNMKNSLRRRHSIRQEQKKFLFTWEYAKDIISYLATIEKNLLVTSSAVEQLVHKSYRTAYVNWLMILWESKTPNNEPVYFMALRIFDWTIVNLKLRENNYKLAAAVSYWIATKYLTNAQIQVSKLFSILNGKYTKNEILAMEAIIIKKLHFKLAIVDPYDFLNYYLKMLNLDMNQHLEHSTQFVIECSTLFESYMVTEPSFLATAALCCAYKVLCQSSEIFYRCPWYQSEKLQYFVNKVLVVCVRYTVQKNYAPIAKFSSAHKLNVVQYFINV